MSVKAVTKWLTVCLYYHEPWESFLSKAVKPYLDVVMQTGVAERFYFQRSWERGPHIRICFKGNAYILEQMLKPNLQEYFLQYFESRPSFPIDPPYPKGYPEGTEWYPNHSIQYFDDEPVLSRLGRDAGLSSGEKQLQASSELVLDVLKKNAGRWNFNEMASTAIKFHLGFAYAAGMRMEETQHFFQWMMENWVKRQQLQASKNRKAFDGDATLGAFQKILDIQRKDIVPYHAALWELLKNYRKFDDPLFTNWLHTGADTSLELNLALDSGKLAAGHQIPQDANGDDAHFGLWGYFAELVQLLDNQLGIHHKNEGYLLYVIAQSLWALRQGTPSLARVGF